MLGVVRVVLALFVVVQNIFDLFFDSFGLVSQAIYEAAFSVPVLFPEYFLGFFSFA